MRSSTATTWPRSAQPEPGGSARLVLRAAGGGSAGAGHVGRCAALAAAWGPGAVVAVDPEVRSRAEVLAPGAVVEAPADPGALGDLVGDGWLVVDGYDFDAAWVDRTGVPADRRLLIDDHGHGERHDAAVVLDQNLGATPDDYPRRPPGSTLLLGARYALVRGADPERRDRRRPVRRLLVALGGEPTPALVERVRHTLAALDVPVVDVVGGGDLCRLADLPGVSVHGFVANVPGLMAGADLALAAAGTTTWDLCRHGLPSVLLAVADNQVPVARAVIDAGAALGDGDPGELLARLVADPGLRCSLADRARRLVDGRGPRRVVAAIHSHQIDLRPATAADARLLFDWANDAVVRAASFDPTPIDWPDHEAWLARRLADPGSRLYLAQDGDRPWGLVRVEGRSPDIAEVGVTVGAADRGRGRAAALIRAGTRSALAELADVEEVVARIRPENHRSAAAFDQAGYVPVEASGPIELRARRSDGW
jgi:UDP-2,4-diacetamido-2,4,6-trideoxy-beta-L-altropyranose hydrolase